MWRRGFSHRAGRHPAGPAVGTTVTMDKPWEAGRELQWPKKSFLQHIIQRKHDLSKDLKGKEF